MALRVKICFGQKVLLPLIKALLWYSMLCWYWQRRTSSEVNLMPSLEATNSATTLLKEPGAELLPYIPGLGQTSLEHTPGCSGTLTTTPPSHSEFMILFCTVCTCTYIWYIVISSFSFFFLKFDWNTSNWSSLNSSHQMSDKSVIDKKVQVSAGVEHHLLIDT